MKDDLPNGVKRDLEKYLPDPGDALP
jgi:hypothetical protein